VKKTLLKTGLSICGTVPSSYQAVDEQTT